MRKLFVLLLFLLLFSSCTYEEDLEFYRGEKQKASKLLKICQVYDLPVRSLPQPDGSLALKGPKDLRFLYAKMLSVLDPFFLLPKQEGSEFDFREFFIPKRNDPKLNGDSDLVLSGILNQLEHQSSIISVKLDSTKDLDGRFVLDIFYVHHPLIEKDVDLFVQSLIRENNSLSFTKNPIAMALDAKLEREDLRVALSTFEPFSFRVLNSERNVAGTQFVLLLLLFLLSGFILGLWWKGRT